MHTEALTRPAAIRISGVVTRRRRRTAIEGVDLTVPAGEVVAVLGPPGAGKSTIVELLLGLIRPDVGEVSVHGLTPRRAVRAGRVGAMLQHGALLDDCSVYETVALLAALHRTGPSVTAALTLAGVADLARRRCDGLTGGQRQQVLFAAALTGDPDLLVLDEPTAGMDDAACRGFWAAARALRRRGKTILFTAGAEPPADACTDRTVVLPVLRESS